MTTPHTIEVTITPDGEVKAQVEGISGPQCGPLSEFLDELGEVTHDEPTPDYYAAVEVDEQISAGRNTV